MVKALIVSFSSHYGLENFFKKVMFLLSKMGIEQSI